MRVAKQTGYVLHTRPYKESSLLVELFTREHGRLTVLAKGARRLKSRQRGLMRPFLLLMLSWSGRGELPVLTQAEALSRAHALDRGSLWCGFYLNELLVRLLHRHDSHAVLFDRYAGSLEALSENNHNEVVLRLFEKKLLSELGYALDLNTESNTGLAIDTHNRYRYIPVQGLVKSPNGESGNNDTISGASLLALANEDFADPRTLIEAKRLMRKVIGYYLGGKPLHSRAGYTAGTLMPADHEPDN